MNRTAPHKTALLLLVALAVATSCSDEAPAGRDAGHHAPRPDAAAVGPDAAPPPGEDAGTLEPPDAEGVEPPDADGTEPPDATVEPPDAATPPARVLVPMRLLGDSPPDNHVMDPGMNSPDTWYAYYENSYSTLVVHRPVLARTPANMPLLALAGDGNHGPVMAATLVYGGAGPFDVSVWLGQPSRASEPAALSAMLQVMADDPAHFGSVIFDLVPDPSTLVTLDSIRWMQLKARVDADLLGWGYLMVFDSTGRALYVTGASLTRDTSRAKPARPDKPGRALTAREKQITKRLLEDTRKRMQTGALAGPRGKQTRRSLPPTWP